MAAVAIVAASMIALSGGSGPKTSVRSTPFVSDAAGTWRATSVSLGIASEVRTDGWVWISAEHSELNLHLESYGRGAVRQPFEPKPTQISGQSGSDAVNISRIPLRESYEFRPDGLHHEITVLQSPQASPGKVWVRLAMAHRAKVRSLSQSGVEVRTDHGSWTYTGLKVWDARSRELPSEMTGSGSTISIMIDDRDAVYPITIDPTWRATQIVQPSDSGIEDRFGSAVAISGDTAIVGANVKNSRQGAAYVFVRQNGIWSQSQKLTASDAANENYFGTSVAIDGDYLAVGAYLRNKTKGAVYVYKRVNGVWTEQQILTVTSGFTYDYFGFCISLSGDTLVASADGQARNRGAAYVFVRKDDVWSQTQRLTSSDGEAGDTFSWSLSLSGDNLLIGAHAKKSNTGQAYLFQRSRGIFTEKQKFVASDAAKDNYFGLSVSMSGNVVAIGALGHRANEGVVYVYETVGGAWKESQVVEKDPGSSLYLGSSIFLRGDTLLASASDTTKGAGYVVVFGLADGKWTERLRLTRDNGTLDDKFGFTLAMGDGAAILGCTTFDQFRGAAYFYDVVPNQISISFDRSTITGGESCQGSIHLQSPAPAGGLPVYLEADQAALVIPRQVVIPEGKSDATFAATTDLLSAPVTTTVTGRAWGDITGQAVLQINPGKITVTFDPASILAGKSGVGTVTVSPAWLASKAKLGIKSDQDGVIVPIRVVIPAGKSTATFSVDTLPTTTEYSANVTIRGTGMSPGVGVLKVRQKRLSLAVDPGEVAGGQLCKGTITLSDPAGKGGSVVALASKDVVVPSSVTIPEGGTTATFSVISSPTTNEITTTIEGSTAGYWSGQATLTVRPPNIRNFSLAANSVVGTKSVSATLDLDGVVGTGGLPVAILSSDWSVGGPSINFFLIPAGAQSYRFDVGTRIQTQATDLQLSACTALSQMAAALRVLPPTLSMKLSPDVVVGGSSTSVKLTLSLDIAAPSGGVSFALASSDPAVTLPSTVNLPARGSSVSVSVNHSEVSEAKSCTLSAQSLIASGSVVLTVKPNQIASLTINPNQVKGGSPLAVNGTMTLAKPAGPGGVKVTLQSSSTYAEVPTSVLIPAGNSTATFAISHRVVPGARSAIIQATLNSRSITAELRLTP